MLDLVDGSMLWLSTDGGAGGGGPVEPTGKLNLIDRTDLLRTITVLLLALLMI